MDHHFCLIDSSRNSLNLHYFIPPVVVMVHKQTSQLVNSGLTHLDCILLPPYKLLQPQHVNSIRLIPT